MLRSVVRVCSWSSAPASWAPAAGCSPRRRRPARDRRSRWSSPRTSGAASRRQLGGDRVHVTSIIANPDTDPHAYEAKPGRRAGHRPGPVRDPERRRLRPLGSQAGGRQPGARAPADGDRRPAGQAGDNPHFWYSPDYVDRVIDRITADLKTVDAADAAYFDQQGQLYRTAGLKDYRDTIAAIRLRYAGVPVGATESIFAYMANGGRPGPDHAARVPEGDQRGNRPQRGRQGDGRPADRHQVDQGLRLQLPEHHPRRELLGRQGQGPEDPGRRGHRDADAGRRHLPGLADQAAEGAPGGARWLTQVQ